MGIAKEEVRFRNNVYDSASNFESFFFLVSIPLMVILAPVRFLILSEINETVLLVKEMLVKCG